MSTRLQGPRSLLGGWLLIVLVLHSACATGIHRAAHSAEPGFESATVYELDFMESGAVSTRPVPIDSAGFGQALQRLSRDVRLARKTAREAAHEWLGLLPQQPQESAHG